MSQKVPDTRRLLITSRSMVTTFSAEFIILACTSTSRLSPVPTPRYLRLVFVLSFMKFHFTMQCNALEFQSVYLWLDLELFCTMCTLLLLTLFGHHDGHNSGPSKSQTHLKILKEICVTFGRLSHSSSKKLCLFLFTKFIKKNFFY